MSKSFKRKLSGIIAFVMLFTTVFSNVMTVFAGGIVDGSTVSTPVKGESYEFKFASAGFSDGIADEAVVDGNTVGLISFQQGKTNAIGYNHDHGIQFKGGSFSVKVAGPTILRMGSCCYNSGTTTIKALDESGKEIENAFEGDVSITEEKNLKCYRNQEYAKGTKIDDTNSIKFTYIGKDAATLVVTTNGTYVPYVLAEYYDTTDYSYEVLLKDVAKDDVIQSGYIAATGDSVKLFNGAAGETEWKKKADVTLDDGTKIMGYYAGQRDNTLLKDTNHTYDGQISTLPADGQKVLFKAPAKGIFVTYLDAGKGVYVYEYGTDDKLIKKHDYSGAQITPSLAFVVDKGHSYVITTTTGTNNCWYAGFKFMQDAPAKVNIIAEEGNVSMGDYQIELINSATKLVEATISDTAVEVTLTMNNTYNVRSQDINKKVTINGGTTFTVDGSDLKLKVEDAKAVEVSGAITCDDSSFDVSDIESITFSSIGYKGVSYTFTPEECMTGSNYKVSLKHSDYNTSIKSKSGNYKTADRVSVPESGAITNEIYVEKIINKVYDETPVYGGIYEVPFEIREGVVSNFNFNGWKWNNATSITNGNNNPATITFKVAGAAKIKVGGWYSGTWNINGGASVTADQKANSSASKCVYAEYTSAGAETITVTATDIKTYIYTIEVDYLDDATEALIPTNWKSTINVPEDYATLNEAIKAIKLMDRPKDEAGRVTIELHKDLQEQVVVDEPYVTLNGNGHTISWYYFTIGSYYSCDSTGIYSEALFRDKYSKNPASGSLWGGVVIIAGPNVRNKTNIAGSGDHFIAHDVTFKNTCNYEVTDKEVLDGAEDTVLGLRTKGMDVEVYADKERGNALYTDGNYCEFYNCNILSSQDTLGVNGRADTYNYFKNCVIGGNVDYICGAGTMVFDDCELQWKTYSDVENGKNNGVGYIVAPKDQPYVFRNCTVTADKDLGDAVVKGMFGRTWGANSQAYFINTKTNGLVEGWGEMNKGDNTTAKFFEYNSISADGETATYPSGYGKELTDTTILNNYYTDASITELLNGWTPVYYELSKAYDPAFVPQYKLSVAYDLTGAKVDGEAVDTVLSGGSFEVKLVAEEGYQLPEVADLTATDSAVQVTGATADSYTLAADKASATLKVKDVTANVKVKVVATEVEGGDDSGNKPGDDTPTTPETYEYKFGDVNLDGDVNTKDATAIIAEVLRKGADKYITNDADYLKVADVNGDGEITPKDATAIVTDVLKKEADKVLPNTIIKVSKDLKAAYGNK